MSLITFLKTKILNLILLGFAIVILYGILSVYGLPIYSIIYIWIIVGSAGVIPMIYEFLKKRGFYNSLSECEENFDKLYLLSEVLERPDFFEGEMLYEALKISGKSMNDEIAKYRLQTEDYIEYIEKWVHEIKTPIAGAKLACVNRDENSWEDISEDLDRIEGYVNETLFYSRVNNAEKDYMIKRKTLDKIVSNALKANAKPLIKNGFSMQRENLELEVLTDEKCVNFIAEQIISNSVKYKSRSPKIVFSGRRVENGTYLDITDNGVGIDPADLPRIFEKNFTGGNGRLNKRSTGFGLYLSKKLCEKMGIEISASSIKGEGTTISIYFPRNNFTNM